MIRLSLILVAAYANSFYVLFRYNSGALSFKMLFQQTHIVTARYLTHSLHPLPRASVLKLMFSYIEVGTCKLFTKYQFLSYCSAI